MIAATFASRSILVLNDAPDWDSMSAVFESVTQMEAGLSGREGRRPVASTMRARLRYGCTLEGAAAFATQAALRSYTTQPIVVPLWPMATTWANRASIQTTGGLRIAWRDDWSQWELYTTTEPAWATASDNVAPALWGDISGESFAWVSAGVARLDVDLTEDGPADYQLLPATVSFAAGPSLSGYATAPRLLPWSLNWSRDIEEGFQFRLLSERIGFGRQPLEVAYQTTPARQASFGIYAESQAATWQMLAFWRQHAPGATFWAPTWRSAVVMSSDIAAGSTTLNVASASGISSGDYLAFLSGPTVAATARIQSIAGNVITLATAPGAFSASHTVVAPLVLARLDKPRLEVAWESSDVAMARVSVVEVPPEYAPAADETLGTTLGLLGTRALLYDITQTIGGVTTTTRATSHDADLTLGANTYAARKVNHGPIRGSLFLDRDEVSVDSEVIPGDALVKLATAQAEAPVRITIRTANVSGSTASGDAVVFVGDVSNVQVRGSKLTARCVSAGSVFDRIFPRFRMQPGCNHALFSTGCGLAAADWRFTASISGTPVAGYPFAINLASLARAVGSMPTITAGWFAGGWIEFGAGASLCRRAILNSTAPVSGALTVNLARDPSPIPAAGSAVSLYPGCDGAKATCADKFANYVNFGGHPFMPPSNPSLVKMSQNMGGGKK